jgi:hypothetical protein
MIIDLEVPYAEKDLAKNFGARWNPVKRIWFVRLEGETDVPVELMRWMPRRLVAIQAPAVKLKTKDYSRLSAGGKQAYWLANPVKNGSCADF